jgi:threonine synthase
MVRRIDPRGASWPDGTATDPFIRYRTLFRAYQLARGAGWTDARYVALVRRIEAAIAAVDGHGFSVTPLIESVALADRLGIGQPGTILVKDETGSVAGSHKARHLMGILLELEVEEALGRSSTGRPLAIASCGNAALAAAVVARAADRPLHVFVPSAADPVVVTRLTELGARVETCPRRPGMAGDPAVERLRVAIASGAIPFTCQGDLDGLAIEGGETLGWELASQLPAVGRRLDRIVVQVGGGALASGLAQGLAEAQALGALDGLPRFDTVQTAGAWPLRRAHERVLDRLARDGVGGGPGRPVDLAAPIVARILDEVARHRSAYMWPWEIEPRSVAHGILDDETYDWLAVVRAMLATGGGSVIADESTLREARAIGLATTGIDADETGTAGLAGLLALARRGDLATTETVAILFTGIRRTTASDGATTRPTDRS